MKNKKAGYLRFKQFSILIFLICVVIIPYIWFQGLDFRSLSKLGYLGIFIINFITSATVIFPIPGAATAILGGAVLNPVLVGISAGIGAAIGEGIGYLAGFEGRRLLRKYEKKKSFLIRLEYLFKLNGFATILICALLPFPFFDFVGILAGVLKYPVWKFFLAVLLGRILRDIVLAWSGAKLL